MTPTVTSRENKVLRSCRIEVTKATQWYILNIEEVLTPSDINKPYLTAISFKVGGKHLAAVGNLFFHYTSIEEVKVFFKSCLFQTLSIQTLHYFTYTLLAHHSKQCYFLVLCVLHACLCSPSVPGDFTGQKRALDALE